MCFPLRKPLKACILPDKQIHELCKNMLPLSCERPLLYITPNIFQASNRYKFMKSNKVSRALKALS